MAVKLEIDPVDIYISCIYLSYRGMFDISLMRNLLFDIPSLPLACIEVKLTLYFLLALCRRIARMSVPPPPPPPQAGASAGPSPVSNNRGLLLQSIRVGKTLKKTVTVDKSMPTIAGKSSSIKLAQTDIR